MERAFLSLSKVRGFLFLVCFFFLFFLFVTQTESFSSNFISLHKEIHEVYADSFERRAKEFFSSPKKKKILKFFLLSTLSALFA